MQVLRSTKIIASLSTALSLDPLPLFSPCYCSNCKSALDQSSVIDDRHAWCPDCTAVVKTSWFQVPSWTVGVVVLLALLCNFCFWL